MPILAKDVDLWPPDLLSPDFTGTIEQHWHCLCTKPRQDKKLLRRLQSEGKSYCGLLVPKRLRMGSGRIRTSHLPLFPGYVFLFGDSEDRYDAVCTGCVSHVLIVKDGDSLRRDLRQIHEVIESGQPVTSVDRIQRGQSVRIMSGPLAGQTGTLLYRKGKSRLVLSLSFIQRGAEVDIDDALVEPL